MIFGFGWMPYLCIGIYGQRSAWFTDKSLCSVLRLFDLIGEYNLCLNQSLFSPAKLILPIWHVSFLVLRLLQHWGRHTLPPPSVIPSFFSPCRSLWKIIAVHWERYWFGLAMLKEKVSFIFSKTQTKEEKIGHVLESFSHPICVCFLFSPSFCCFVFLSTSACFSSTLFCLVFYFCLAWLLLFMCSFPQFTAPFSSHFDHLSVLFLFMPLSQWRSCSSVRHQVSSDTGYTHPHVSLLYLQVPLWPKPPSPCWFSSLISTNRGHSLS